MIEIKPTGCW